MCDAMVDGRMDSFCSLKFYLLLLCTLFIRTYGSVDLGNGLGDKYEWHSLEDGLKVCKDTGKPLMLIIHKSWCGACKAFKPKFAESDEILELSQHFVMVNTLDNDEPKDDKYSPDGGYIPRILFFNSDGEIQKDIYNKNGNPKYKYFYFDADGVVKSMKEAMELFTPKSTKGDEL